jgi:hypothetical protein
LELLARVRLEKPIARPAELYTPPDKTEIPAHPNVLPFPTSAERFGKDSLATFETVTHRIVLTIGTKRKQFDITTRVVPLASSVGDHPAPVIPLRPNATGSDPKGDGD